MFQYGSFKLFAFKIFFGLTLIAISVFTFASILTYNPSDPGFRSIGNLNDQNIRNFFGIIGSKYSSFLLVFIGHSSFIFSTYFLVCGIKYFLGIKHYNFILKFIIIFLCHIFINIFLDIFKFEQYEYGIISKTIINLYDSFLINYSINNFIDIILKILVFVFSLYLLLISFNVKIKYLKKLNIFKYLILLLSFLKFFIILFKIFNRSKVKSKKKIIKNEPSFSSGIKKIYSKDSKSTKPYKNEKDLFKFSLPNKDLLKISAKKSSAGREQEKINIQAATRLEKTLLDYGVEGKIIGFKSGPIVTLFEFVPKAGIKASKVIGLSDDIARAMSSYSARIASQPGKQSLGIEIPNLKRDSVLLGDLINDINFDDNQYSLRLALGKDISGEIIFADLEKMPHLLIAGTTGSGKSVGINAMILSLLFKFKPDECKLILIDPKMLELSIYEDIPHLLTPVVTDSTKAVTALKWVVKEMENRYKLMSSLNVKNIQTYNDKVLRTLTSGKKLFREVQTGIDADTKIPIIEKREIPLEKMPFIVVVVDEMADLMMVAGKEVESLVQRLAQMARASGIHLITATQRPSVDVITGTIKANFPSRISFKVASKFDSRTILNEMGAEQLLGSGDMLFLENGGNIKRLHGGFVTENEVESVVNEIKSQSTFDHTKEISLSENDSNLQSGFNLLNNNTDELYEKAVEIVISQQKVSTSYIQRYLQIGYNRAARIVEKMEDDGIISEANNAGKRDVLKKK